MDLPDPLHYCEITRFGPVTVIRLNRPEVMNALHEAAHRELHTVFDAFAADESQWVAILTGAGERAFCAGYDLKSLTGGGKEGWAATGFGGLARRFDCAKPIIAAVNGIAFGGGFEMVLACDIAVASERASFALPEPKFGLAAVSGGLHRLPRQIGLKHAMGMILTGRRVDAQEGLKLGFLNEVVPAGEEMAAAMRWAQEICRCSPASIRASKEAVLAGLDRTLARAIGDQENFPAMKAMYASDDFIEGPRAFAEKRPPCWSGAAASKPVAGA
ncbi:enoyl-CoA hydratase-related protein [Xanthobacter sp. DSM 24535]|uniref:enoyl-CoA hydratase-related protein n=1 Tax=Roseixanthobacter psychrophilus TaxID=3119917 RepID=UPI00372C5710